ncbi:MAG: DegT/DnrJ/EryC1/StrS family aminotransferase [Myxococcota bacterium]|nr:DegT/DnrJ/EryC1/StrS family aminotransferase [Myxococcota bacterium]
MSDATRVSLLDLEPQLAGIRSEVDAAIARVLDRGRFILGEEVEQFERDFAQHCQTSNAVGCASGTDALLLSLMALGVGPGDQVICPAYSFFASAGVIARLGATPVFADIDPGSLSLDPKSVEEAASRCRSLRAVVVVHLFGRTADSEALRPIAEQHGATLIHDAAQAVGALDEAGKPVGASGELSAFSFYPSKNLGAFGDAGAVTTGDTELAKRVRQLRVHGASTPCYHEAVGINSRLDELQAAVLTVRLRHVESGIAERLTCADEYDARLAGHADLALPERPPGSSRARHGFHQYTVRVPAEQRDTLINQLREGGIDSTVYYPRPLHQQPCFASTSQPTRTFPEAEAAARETLSLPIYPGLRTKAVHRIAAQVRSFLSSTGSVRTK